MRRFILWLAVCVTPGALSAQTTIFLGSNDVTGLAVGADAVYWSSEGGAGIFWPGDSTYASLTSVDRLGYNNLTAVGVDSTGSVWFGTSANGVRVDSSGSWFTLNSFVGGVTGRITCLTAAREGMWIGTADSAYHFVGRRKLTTVSPAGGLLPGAVLSILVEGEDRIWFGTEGGLSLRTDLGWEYHLLGESVRALAFDRNGVLWASTRSATLGRVYRWEGTAWTLATAGLADPDVSDLLLAGDVLWAGSEEGPAWYDEGGQTWVMETSGLVGFWVTALAYRESLGLWAGIRGEGVALWTSGVWGGRSPSSPATNYISDIDVDPRGDIWCGTGSDDNLFPLSLEQRKGLLHASDEVWEAFRQANSPLPTENVYRVAADARGYIWAGTWGLGLFRYAPDSGVWDTLSVATGDLFSNRISALVRGRDGEVWFAEYGQGIAVVDTDLVVTHFGPNEGLPTIYYRSLAVDSLGRVWGGGYGVTGEGEDPPSLTVLDRRGTPADTTGVEVEWYAPTFWGDGTQYPVHGLACTPEGGVWLGVKGGKAWTDGDSWVPVDESCGGSSTGDVRAVAVDPGGGVWFATSRGLGEWRDSTWTLHETVDGGIATNNLMSLAYDASRHTLWVGTWGGGVSRWRFGAPQPPAGESAYAYPNPFRPDRGHTSVRFSGLAAGTDVTIYTVDGEEVQTLVAGGAGWDGRNRSGEPVAGGLYVFVGEDARGSVRIGRVAVIR